MDVIEPYALTRDRVSDGMWDARMQSHQTPDDPQPRPMANAKPDTSHRLLPRASAQSNPGHASSAMSAAASGRPGCQRLDRDPPGDATGADQRA